MSILMFCAFPLIPRFIPENWWVYSMAGEAHGEGGETKQHGARRTQGGNVFSAVGT